jgi:hypothetical protein
MDRSPLHDAIVREICIALDAMGADAKLLSAISSMEEHESPETVYLRMCENLIKRAAREMEDGWN